MDFLYSDTSLGLNKINLVGQGSETIRLLFNGDVLVIAREGINDVDSVVFVTNANRLVRNRIHMYPSQGTHSLR